MNGHQQPDKDTRRIEGEGREGEVGGQEQSAID